MPPRRHRRGVDARGPRPRIDPSLPVIGWREWLGLPELGIHRVKAKVDTGARSSCLHALELEEFRRGRTTWVRFVVHPDQRSTERSVVTEAKVLEHRMIRSSNGKSALRPVVVTPGLLHGTTWPIELTLASRAQMGFRMLLGREAIRRRFLVDPGKSYCAGRATSRPDLSEHA